MQRDRLQTLLRRLVRGHGLQRTEDSQLGLADCNQPWLHQQRRAVYMAASRAVDVILRFYTCRQHSYATVRCRLRHYTNLPWREIKTKTRWNQKWAAGPHKSRPTQRSKRQVRKSDLSELRWEHPQVKA